MAASYFLIKQEGVKTCIVKSYSEKAAAYVLLVVVSIIIDTVLRVTQVNDKQPQVIFEVTKPYLYTM